MYIIIEKVEFGDRELNGAGDVQDEAADLPRNPDSAESVREVMAQIDEDYQSGGVPCRILWCDCEIMVNGVTLDATGWKVMV